ncbi:MAG: hypothetical protein F6K42_04290 [Leptolyngbya sp. SIO1D8]|nr:hypothetical protein [Leptolyngbya sp. SIO1D8]
MPSLLLRPGVSVRLKRQPLHMPDFWVVRCRGDRAWIRQPDWPSHIQLCVRVTQLAMPGATSPQNPIHCVSAVPPR